MSYPYLDLQICSHVHPKFVICNIGWQLQLQQNEDRFNDFSSQHYMTQEAESKDSRWLPRLERLDLCWRVYGAWKLVNEQHSDVLAWKNQGGGASRSEIVDSVTGVSRTTEGRYPTRSSGRISEVGVSRPTEGRYQTRSSGWISQVASPNPRMPSHGKGSIHRRNP